MAAGWVRPLSPAPTAAWPGTWLRANGDVRGTIGADLSAPGLWGHGLQPSCPCLGAGRASTGRARGSWLLRGSRVRWEPYAGARAGNRGRGSSESGSTERCWLGRQCLRQLSTDRPQPGTETSVVVTRKQMGTAVTRCGCSSAVRHTGLWAANGITGLPKTLQTSVVLHLNRYRFFNGSGVPISIPGRLCGSQAVMLTWHRALGVGHQELLNGSFNQSMGVRHSYCEQQAADLNLGW